MYNLIEKYSLKYIYINISYSRCPKLSQRNRRDGFAKSNSGISACLIYDKLILLARDASAM